MIKGTYGNHVAYDLKRPFFNAIKRSHWSGGVWPRVIHEAAYVNRAAALPQKPRKRLAQQRGAPRAFRTTHHLLIVEASVRASAAKSRRDRCNLRWLAAAATRIHAARKDAHRRAAEMADAHPDDA